MTALMQPPMVTPPSPTLATVDEDEKEVLPTPEELVRLANEAGIEFVNGRLVEKPVSVESSLIAGGVHELLGQSNRPRTARIAGADLCYQCFPNRPGKYRKPDVSAIRLERLAGVTPGLGMMPIPADLVVEVVSPGDDAEDLNEKVEEYLGAGFKIVWVVYRSTKTVHVHRADGSVAVLRGDDEITADDVLPAFRCKVAEFFA